MEEVLVRSHASVFGRERERAGERASGGELRLQQHMLSIQKTYTAPLVNKVLAMPLGSNLDCDLRRCRGSACVCTCVCLVSPWKHYSGGLAGPPSDLHICVPPLAASAGLAAAAHLLTRTEPSQVFGVWRARARAHARTHEAGPLC